MNKILSFIKKFWFVPLILLIAVIYVTNLLIQAPKNKPTPTLAAKATTFGVITPGVSTIDQVNNSLGKPINTKTENNSVISDYKSKSVNRFHQVTLTNGTVSLIKEIVTLDENIKSDYMTKQYGDSIYILYPKSNYQYFDLHVYPSNGIAYLGHTDGTVSEIWYFQPTTIDDFLKTWGNDYSTTLPSNSAPY
jgi:hypothetical protein